MGSAGLEVKCRGLTQPVDPLPSCTTAQLCDLGQVTSQQLIPQVGGAHCVKQVKGPKNKTYFPPESEKGAGREVGITDPGHAADKDYEESPSGPQAASAVLATPTRKRRDLSVTGSLSTCGKVNTKGFGNHSLSLMELKH